MKKFFVLMLAFLFSIIGFAQDAAPVEMADGLRSSGKIYIVVGILATIFLGIVIYLVMIDRKISDTEKKLNKK